MTDSAVPHKEIPLSNLDLDCENPRHGPVADQRAALARLIVDQRDKIVRIAVDIHDYGLSPAQLFIVIPGEAGRFTVLDGNRRLAAMRILEDPRLLPAELHTAEFIRATSEPRSHPGAVMCAVLPNRDDARPWLDRSHGGQLSGVGPIPWSSAAKYRFDPNPSSRGHTASAIRVLDWLRLQLEPADPVHANLDIVESDRVTNLGRLVGDPDIRDFIGFDFQSGIVVLNDDTSAVVRRLLTIIRDLAGDTTVTQLKQKGDRRFYANKMLQDDIHRTPDSDILPEDPARDPTTDPGETETPATDTPKKRRRPQTPAHPFADVDIGPLHPRIQQLTDEVRRLEPDKFPNAIAVLLRAIIELTVTEYLHAHGRQPGQDKKLPTRIRDAMQTLGITDGDARFQPLRTKLKERDSIISVPNLHQYVHNVNAVPGKSDLDSIAFAYRPLLEKICSDLAGRQSTAA